MDAKVKGAIYTPDSPRYCTGERSPGFWGVGTKKGLNTPPPLPMNRNSDTGRERDATAPLSARQPQNRKVKLTRISVRNRPLSLHSPGSRGRSAGISEGATEQGPAGPSKGLVRRDREQAPETPSPEQRRWGMGLAEHNPDCFAGSPPGAGDLTAKSRAPQHTQGPVQLPSISLHGPVWGQAHPSASPQWEGAPQNPTGTN